MPKATLFDSRIKKYAYCEPSQICRDLGTSFHGLSEEQATQCGNAMERTVFRSVKQIRRSNACEGRL